MKRSQQGFTIIELVVVIAILGILSAIALPKFADLTKEAKDAAFDGVQGGFVAAVMVAHSKWLALGADSSNTLISMEGGTVRMTATGWPDVTGTAEELYARLMNGPAPSNWTYSESGTTAYFALDGAGDPPAGDPNSFVYHDDTGAVTN